jgi:hypothetical protein
VEINSIAPPTPGARTAESTARKSAEALIDSLKN